MTARMLQEETPFIAGFGGRRDPREMQSDEDAEQAVLSAMLMDGAEAVPTVRRIGLRDVDFAQPRHATIFRALLALDAGAVALDPLTLSAQLGAELQSVGGKDYIAYLIDAVPTAANVEYHAKIVLDRAKSRGLADELETNARLLRENRLAPDKVAARLQPALIHLAAEAESSRPFPLVHVLEGEPLSPPTLQVADLVIDRDLNLWTGHGGAGKTVLLYTTAIGVVLGTPVFGSLAVHRSGPVLLVIPEDGQAAARMILDAIVEGLGLGSDQHRELREKLVMVPDDAEVRLTVDTQRLGATARELEAVMVLLDPLSNLLGGASERDEDVATTTSAALRRDVCRRSNATVLLSHHLRKPGKDWVSGEAEATVHDTRGSGAWMNSARLGFGVSKKGNRIKMACLKSNRLKSDLSHEFDLEIVSDPDDKAHWLSCRVTDANAGSNSDSLTPGIGREVNANERTALSCLDDTHEPGLRLSWSRWRETSGLNPNTFKSVRARLLSAGLAAPIDTGRKARGGGPEFYYEITSAGRGAVATGWVAERSRGEGVRKGD